MSLDFFQLIEGGEDPIGQRFVGKRPEPRSCLYLWGIRWHEHQVDPLRQFELSTAMPASTICLSGPAPLPRQQGVSESGRLTHASGETTSSFLQARHSSGPAKALRIT